MENSKERSEISGASIPKLAAEELAAQFDDLFPTMASRFLHFIDSMPGTDITRVQEFLLRHLYAQGPCTASTIGAMLGITSGPVTGLTKRLIDKGLVERRRDLEDGRVYWFSLTSVGIDFVQRVSRYRQAEWKRLIETIGVERASEGLYLMKESIRTLNGLLKFK